MDSAGRRRTLRSIGRASESSGFEAACEAALRVVEGGRVPDDATVDVLARRIAGGGGEAGGADLSVYDGFLSVFSQGLVDKIRVVFSTLYASTCVASFTRALNASGPRFACWQSVYLQWLCPALKPAPFFGCLR